MSEQAAQHRPIPRAWRETKVRIEPTRFGFDVEVVEGLMYYPLGWALTRAGVERKVQRFFRRQAIKRQRREQAVEIVVDRDEP